ncbi:MAG: tRNA (adenosine(37)-N6)-threonylcarbamoyltransferase complex ATPase subunit type 1 TsaE [Candidatus Peribacteraceae bacterium]|nr:tRNA (adenosine(37)-N6)-threonylcarbamoyltransferase complex ATPase subunit type 1 TsaE [Candidatus Peribacteraceae bacterium]
MSIIDTCSLRLQDAENTVAAGRSLAQTLYVRPLTILLSGELGSGKTTFMQGLAHGLGIREPVTSPTYALEQRYRTDGWGELLHLDLYRLHTPQARELLQSTEGFEGIRCIEWPEKLETDLNAAFPERIEISLHEDGAGRRADIRFTDAALPSSARMEEWRTEVRLPPNIVRHCHAVAEVCGTVADALLSRGTVVRKQALLAAGKTHDLLRFIDFHDGASPPGITHTPEEEAIWDRWRNRYPNRSHEDAAAAFLRERGFGTLADIVVVHGLHLPPPERPRTEQRLLFYADKRVVMDRVVSLEERFADFRERYGRGKSSPRSVAWFKEAKALERELFPDGPPL